MIVLRALAIAAIATVAMGGVAIGADSQPPSSPPFAQLSDNGDTPVKMTPQQRAFGERMVKAIQQEDADELKKLVAPGSLACFNQNKQAFFDTWLDKHFRYKVAKHYSLSVAKLGSPAGTSKSFTYPVAPTHTLEIQFENSERQDITLNRLIAQQDGKWFEVAPCPTQSGMDRFNKIQAAKGEARAKAAYARVDQALAGRIREFIAHDDQANALKLCAESLHVDSDTARQVVAMLANEKPK
jgi:hypothetical protein